LLVGSLAAWVVAQGPPETVPEPAVVLAPAVDALVARPRDVTVAVRTHGVVEPGTEIDLVAETAGRVRSASSSFAAGGSFAEGDLLLELDDRDARVALDRAEAIHARLKSELGLAQAQLERLRALARRDVASAARLDDAEHAARIAQAQLREALAVEAQARLELERTRVYAPFAGRVRDKRIDVGQFVARGTPLARIYAVEGAEVRLPVSASDLMYLQLPMNGSSPDAGPPVRLRARFGDRDAEWNARVVRTEGQIAPRSRMLHVVARVDAALGSLAGPEGVALTAGQFVEAEIGGRTLRDVIVLPRSALHDARRVFVLDAESRLRGREIEVLRLEEDHVLVGAGLTPGDRVSLSPLRPEEGLEVRARLREDGLPSVAAPETLP
jgi:RND family efflux transporter MFP subunit